MEIERTILWNTPWIKKVERERERRSEREGGRGKGLKSWSESASPLEADESNQQAIPNGWKDMQMRARETAVGNACLPEP